MTDVALWVLLPLALLLVLGARVARRGLQMRQLCLDGVETTGTVLRKVRFNGSGPRTGYLRYRYRLPDGTSHTHRALVSDEVWRSHREGGSIAVVYSASRPRISAPRYMVELSRRALRVRNPAGR